MRNRLDTEEFEDYLQRQADHHRMYPSGFLWNNIRDSLHGKPKWPALTYSALFIIVTLIITTIFLDPGKNPLQTSARQLATAMVKKQASLEEHISAAYITRSTINKINYSQAVAAVNNFNIQAQPFVPEPFVATQPSKNTFSNNSLSFAAVSSLKPNLVFLQGTESVEHKDGAATLDDLTLATKESESQKESGLKQIPEGEKMKYFPVVTLGNKKKPSRLEWQAHITPSASYRRLVDENHHTPKTYVTAVPVSASYSIDVNDVVRHRPGLGMEAGFSIGYHLTEQLLINAGLQYSARGYDIQAFAYNYEQTAITLLSSTGSQTLNSYSQYRLNALGYPILLKNRYHDISIPIGVEWRGSFNKRLAWGIGATVQPTYVFNRTPFIVTTNYKSYTEATNLVQNFNINTSIETYLSYRTGSLRWQIGPQFRYQQSPTFSNKYPIREYLMDYGVKLGVTKSFR